MGGRSKKSATGNEAKPGKDAQFDQVMQQLQSVVEKLEEADLPLEESLAAFERGVTLSRQGQQILDAAERKVEVLLQDGSTKPLASSDEASG